VREDFIVERNFATLYDLLIHHRYIPQHNKKLQELSKTVDILNNLKDISKNHELLLKGYKYIYIETQKIFQICAIKYGSNNLLKNMSEIICSGEITDKVIKKSLFLKRLLEQTPY
jgi:hypothetical protein